MFSPSCNACNHCSTMTSADFSPFVVTTASYSVSTADETSPGTTHFFLSIYLPYLLCTVPYSYRASVCIATLPLCFSLIWFLFVRPEICLHLPSDSVSRRTPLMFGYILPAVGRIRDFHPLETCAAGRTETQTTDHHAFALSAAGSRHDRRHTDRLRRAIQ